MVFAFDATTNVPKTGDAANITAYVSKDYGTVTVLADTSATEMDATNAPGYYLFDAAQGETNADCLMVSGKSATSNIKVIGAPAVIYTRPTTGWLAPTTAGRTLDVSSTGEAGVDWANVGSPTTTLALTGTTIAVTQKVDVDTIKTNPVVNGGTITFPTTATLASTTNITAGTIATVTNLTNAPTNGDFTATMKTSIGAAVWDAATASFGAAGSYGLLVETNLDAAVTSRMATYTQPTGFLSATFPSGTIANTTNITAGTITTVTNLTNAATAGDFTATMKTSLNAATPASNSDITAIKAKTDSLTFTVAGQVDANAESMNATTILGNGTSGNLWRG